jgi:deoxyribodipyrimidine photo-lyase
MRAIHWFRNDLRLDDNTALQAARTCADELLHVFVVDPRFVGSKTSSPSRLQFLEDSLQRLDRDLSRRGFGLIIRVGEPAKVISEILEQSRADLLVFNRDYSPYSRIRDDAVRRAADRLGVRMADYKDRVVFAPEEIRTKTGGFYRVYSPYRRAWWTLWEKSDWEEVSNNRWPRPVVLDRPKASVDLRFDRAAVAARLPTGGEAAARRRLLHFLAGPIRWYGRDRDRPAVDGTSRLSPHLRFGTISVRRCIREALECSLAEPDKEPGVRCWIDEFIWREFYQAILAEEPRVLSESFRPEFKNIAWESGDLTFEAWCRGETGYPFVDAGMRQLRQTGWMHNRVRMVTASFLVKDLLIDWRRGERFFFRHLVDGDPASNNGGWQWAASTGTDAQPYFRIFNPVSQGERFDPEGEYVKRFVPELRNVPARYVHRPWEAPRPPRRYPPPIVDHSEQRALALERFRTARSGRSN